MANAFLIESVALELARSVADEGVFRAPETEIEVLRQVLLTGLSSRVRWEVACSIADNLLTLIDSRGSTLFAALSIDGSDSALSAVLGRHRYPRRTLKWFAEMLDQNGRLLHNALEIITDTEMPRTARQLLVGSIPGFGPKQSSLLLRNLGRGHDLAVLDRHVLHFMHLTGLIDEIGPVATLRQYERIEFTYLEYAGYRRLPADALDLAIWIVMRTVKEKTNSEDRNAGFGRSRLEPRRGSRGGTKARAASAVH
jgi:N-glycosylase/DNA lyase